jgi:hypothetical protein
VQIGARTHAIARHDGVDHPVARRASSVLDA